MGCLDVGDLVVPEVEDLQLGQAGEKTSANLRERTIYDTFVGLCLYFVQLLVRGDNLGWFWLDLFSVLTPCPPCCEKL